jgi:hypothetical protein
MTSQTSTGETTGIARDQKPLTVAIFLDAYANTGLQLFLISMGGGDAMLTGLHHPETFGLAAAAGSKYRLIGRGHGSGDSLDSSNIPAADWLNKGGSTALCELFPAFTSGLPGIYSWRRWPRNYLLRRPRTRAFRLEAAPIAIRAGHVPLPPRGVIDLLQYAASSDAE